MYKSILFVDLIWWWYLKIFCLFKKEIAFNVLKKTNEEIENCKWAQLRLGIIYLQKGDCNEAIRLFYNVIRNDPDD